MPRSERSRQSKALSPQGGQKAVAMSCLHVGLVQIAAFVTTRSPFGASAEGHFL
jgi:hypothetical protein